MIRALPSQRPAMAGVTGLSAADSLQTTSETNRNTIHPRVLDASLKLGVPRLRGSGPPEGGTPNQTDGSPIFMASGVASGSWLGGGHRSPVCAVCFGLEQFLVFVSE